MSPSRLDPVGDPVGQVDLRRRRYARVEQRRGAGLLGIVALGLEVAGEDRRQHQQAGHDARVPGGDRPTAVDRLRRTAGERRLGERREGQREPDPDQCLRREREHTDALGSSARPASPPAIRITPAAARARPRHAACERGRERARERHAADGRGGRDRAQAPALDQQQDDEEQAPPRAPPRPERARRSPPGAGRTEPARRRRALLARRAGRDRAARRAPARPGPGPGRSTPTRSARSAGRRRRGRARPGRSRRRPGRAARRSEP